MKKKIGLLTCLGLVVAIAFGVVALMDSPSVEVAAAGGQPCGGFAGLQCPGARQICVDDPRDDCDPRHGGADCIGICRGRGGNQ